MVIWLHGGFVVVVLLARVGRGDWRVEVLVVNAVSSYMARGAIHQPPPPSPKASVVHRGNERAQAPRSEGRVYSSISFSAR